MTFTATISCDGLNCCNELEIQGTHPNDATIEFDSVHHGWSVDVDGADYCPKCSVEIERDE